VCPDAPGEVCEVEKIFEKLAASEPGRGGDGSFRGTGLAFV
jgi:hypothetical protein